MSLNRPPAEIRRWITSHLDPLDETIIGGMQVRADLSLDPAKAADDTIAWTPAAVLVGLVEREEGLSVLLTRRADTLRRHTGQVAFPGGRCDPGELPWQTALREAEEEIGLNRRFVEPLGYLGVYGTSFGFRILPTVARVKPGFSLRINHSEVDDAFEVPLSFLMNPQNHQIHSKEFRGMERSYYAMPFAERYIWGATAGILRVLYERICLP